MKRLRLLSINFLILLCSCLNNLAGSQDLKQIFEQWRAANVNGDFDTIYKLMSDNLRSQWLYLVMTPLEGETSRSLYVKLPSELVNDFDNWYITASTTYDLKAVVITLPENILRSQWLYEALKKQFELAKDQLRIEFANLKLQQIAEEANEATIIVININQQVELYRAVMTESGWKIDGNISPPKRR